MPPIPSLSRRQVLTAITGIGIGTSSFAKSLANQVVKADAITVDMVRQAEWLAGIELDEDDRERLASGLVEQLAGIAKIRALAVDADVVPAVVFRPDFFVEPDASIRAATVEAHVRPEVNWKPAPQRDLPTETDLPWLSLTEQASLLASKKVSSVELTRSYLQRLEKYDPLLHCVVTRLDDHALEQASASDARRAANQTIGPLDGIPWVAKDLMAVPPWKTTWGAEPYKEQVRPTEATVAERLRQAGSVLLAKVSLGALAWGDKWFGGMTRNPWNPKQGSSGSSAGTAASVAAGLTCFGIGSETLGSIVSPSLRCRVSGLRPSFGRSSRFGCMALSWSMDKLGPIARRVEDLALVFAHMIGIDGRDPTVVERPFAWPHPKPLSELTVGIVDGPLRSTEKAALDWMKSAGIQTKSIQLPSRFPLSAMTAILTAEATTMFDDILRSDPKADLGLWPDSFRRGQFLSAVHYLRANRLRSLLIAETEAALRQVDFVLGADDLSLTNLTGHPSLVVTTGSEEIKESSPRPGTIKLTAAMYRESTLLAIGKALQDAIPPKPDRPDIESFLAEIQKSDAEPTSKPEK